MPELPEIETIRVGLAGQLSGRMISSVEVLNQKTMPYPRELINDSLVGAKVDQLRRFGKVLIIDLDNAVSLIFHLKMTGQMVVTSKQGARYAGGHPTESMVRELPDNSTRVIFEFKGGDKLFFNDQRKFGWIKVVDTAEVEEDPLLKRMGPEPLSKDFTLAGLEKELTSHARAPIKPVILDQSTVAGVGNIYADESLHLAKVHPGRLAGSLKPAEVKRLHQAIKTIIQAGVKHGGTSLAHYVNALGGKGDYLDNARVFRRQGQPCGVCGAIIKKIRLAGRGTHYCPKCQQVKL